MDTEDIYPCIGICTPDPDSGYCLGCGRPPLENLTVVKEEAPACNAPENDKNSTLRPSSEG